MSKLKINRSVIIAIFSVVYGAMISSFPSEYFRDRESYIFYANYSDDIFGDYLSKGILPLLSNEPIFLKLNTILSFFFSPSIVPNVFVFVLSATFFYCFFIRCRNFLEGFFALCLFLLTPTFLHLQLVVIRQGICSAILLLVCILTCDKKKILTTSFFLGFIHSSFFLITFFLFINYILFLSGAKRKIRLAVLCLVTFFISGAYIVIGNFLGLRQVTQEHLLEQTDVSGLAFLMWLSMLCLILFSKPKNTIEEPVKDIAILGLVVYLSMYFTLPFSGRFILSFVPFIFLSSIIRLKLIECLYLIFFIVVNVYILSSSLSNNSLTFTISSMF